MNSTVPIIERHLNEHERRIWEMVARSPLESLWTREGLTVSKLAKSSWQSVMDDHIFSRAAELAFYFFFALFPTLICATSILGLVLRSAKQFYTSLLHYIALLVPSSAYHTILATFHQTTTHSGSGKITISFIAAIWSASIGISAIQETLNGVYKLNERRSYLKARVQAIGLTGILIVTVSVSLGCMFGGNLAAHWIQGLLRNGPFASLASLAVVLTRIVGWTLAAAFIGLSFATTYYWCPDLRARRWHWLTPGSAFAMFGWLLASLAFRVYLYYFNTFTLTYGSLGAVIILLMWFYITGLMILVGAQINSEIESAAVEARIDAAGPSELSGPQSQYPVAPAA